MNFMSIALSEEKDIKDPILSKRIALIRDKISKCNIKIDNKFSRISEMHYYNNIIPLVSPSRDVLKKPTAICHIKVNWKRKPFVKYSLEEINETLQPQWGWSAQVVDVEHSRNKFKNKTVLWAVFDTEEDAKKSMELFNLMFMTAMEYDCVEEYKKFKECPDKRPLTFDQICPTAYELYELVDKGEL